MRDITPLSFTLRVMRDFGEIRARLIANDQHHQDWFAGPKPLNAQAIQGLIADGWPRRDAEDNDVRIDAWPSFATATEDEPMADDLARFSCVRHVGSAETIARARAIRRVFAADLYRDGGGYPAFEMQVEHKNGAGALCLHSNDAGEPGSPPVRSAPRRGTRLAIRWSASPDHTASRIQGWTCSAAGRT